MPMYLESLDGNQSYRTDVFCLDYKSLENGKVYSLGDVGFLDWLRTCSSHKPPAKKLRAVWYGNPND